MELRGNLRDFGLPDIIQLVAFGRKTGALRVASDGGGSALYFEDGNVVHAESPGMEGERAAYSLFRIPAGEFRFQTDVPAPKHTLSLDPTNLVMEAARLLDEAQRDESAETDESEWRLDPDVEFGDGWFFEPTPPRDPAAIKQEIRELLQNRFGKNARRLQQAVDQCGDSEEDLVGLAERVEKYIHVFLDSRASRFIGDQLRAIIAGSPS